jgi:E3 ubiquitin-protein ligase HUWE1
MFDRKSLLNSIQDLDYSLKNVSVEKSIKILLFINKFENERLTDMQYLQLLSHRIKDVEYVDFVELIGELLYQIWTKVSRIEYHQMIGDICDGNESNFCIALKHLHISHPIDFYSNKGRIEIFTSRTMDSLKFSKEQILSKSDGELQQGRLNVSFMGEDGIDVGGLTRDWFALLTEQIKSTELGLLTLVKVDGSEMYIPNWAANSENDQKSFEFFGSIIALAIRHKVVLDIDFVPYIYKQILGIKMRMEDLNLYNREIYKNMIELKMKNVQESDMVPFTVNTHFNVEFKDDFLYDSQVADEFVTNENKEKFFELVIDYFLVRKTQRQMSAIQQGFKRIIPNLSEIPAETLDEFIDMVSGKAAISVLDWKGMTAYQGFSPNSNTIIWFWEILQSFNQDQLKKILSYWTAYKRIPKIKNNDRLGAEEKLFQILRITSQYEIFAHTCFNRLDIPEIAEKADLQAVLESIVNSKSPFTFNRG